MVVEGERRARNVFNRLRAAFIWGQPRFDERGTVKVSYDGGVSIVSDWSDDKEAKDEAFNTDWFIDYSLTSMKPIKDYTRLDQLVIP